MISRVGATLFVPTAFGIFFEVSDDLIEAKTRKGICSARGTTSPVELFHADAEQSLCGRTFPLWSGRRWVAPASHEKQTTSINNFNQQLMGVYEYAASILVLK